MSESDSYSESSPDVDTMPFEKVIENLKSASKDMTESKDFLSYSTMLDIYLNDPYKYTIKEREELIDCLKDILGGNKELMYEIGWDLPELLLKYIESASETESSDVLMEIPLVYKTLKIFEMLAVDVNSKELFLKSCELLSASKLPKSEVDSDESLEVKISYVSIYSVFELVDSCFKRIKTLYPSRFLSMIMTSFISLLQHNAPLNVPRDYFVLKRIYSFARNYASPQLPNTSDSDFSDGELKKIKDDEEYLQKKLLTAFVTQSVHLALRDRVVGLSLGYFSYLQSLNRDDVSKPLYVYDVPVVNRMAELATSFDIDLMKGFKDFVVQTHVLFHSFDYRNTNEEELSVAVYEKVLTDYEQNIQGIIISGNGPEIKDSTLGCLFLFSDQILIAKDFLAIDITFKDSVVLLLRLVVPHMVRSNHVAVGMSDVSVFWSWVALNNPSTSKRGLELEISSIPKVLLSMYFQALLFICSGDQETVRNFRYVVLTLLTRVLSLAPERIAYDFILDSLKNCPFQRIKVILIGILKELLTRKQEDGDGDFVKEFSKVSLKDKSNDAPKLPPRNVPKKSKLIALSEERVSELLHLIDETFDHVFFNFTGEQDDIVPANKEDKTDMSSKLVTKHLSTLSAYLNFLVVVKSDPFFLDRSDFKSMIDKYDRTLSESRKKCSKNGEAFDLNAIDMLQISLDRIKEE